MSAMKRLLLHAGIHRTGTTTVQRSFHVNRVQLAEHGILYPGYPSTPGDSNQNRFAWDLWDFGPESRRMVHEWIEQLASARAHTVVLSAEDFCRLQEFDFLDEFRPYFAIEAVFYLRRQDHWINSWYNQHVKWPFEPAIARATPLEFLSRLGEFHWLNYYDMLGPWMKALGRRNVHLRVLESGQVQDPVADMFDLCGVDFVLERQIADRTNESVPVEHLEVLRRLGTLRYTPKVRRSIVEALGKVPSSGNSNAFAPTVRQLILARYEEQNRLVAEDYLRRKDATLFYDRDFPAAAPGGPGVPLGEDALLAFARGLIEALTPAGDAHLAPDAIASTRDALADGLGSPPAAKAAAPAGAAG
jgi:hypothetical protein